MFEIHEYGHIIILRNLEQLLKFFADIKYLYIDIHYTKKQTESTLSSGSILNLKILFKFVSQCSLEPYLDSGLWNVGNELDNCDFAVL